MSKKPNNKQGKPWTNLPDESSRQKAPPKVLVLAGYKKGRGDDHTRQGIRPEEAATCPKGETKRLVIQHDAEKSLIDCREPDDGMTCITG